MRYINSLIGRTVKLGDLCRLSRHVDAATFVVKRIDTLNEEVYLVEIDGKFGQWVSADCLLCV